MLTDRLQGAIPIHLGTVSLFLLATDAPWTRWLFAAMLCASTLRGATLFRARRRPPTTALGTGLASLAVVAPMAVMAAFTAYAWASGSTLGYLMLVVSGVLLAGGIVVVAPFRALGLLKIGVTVGPVAVATALSGGEGYLVATLTLAGGIYNALLLRKLHRDFWTQRLDHELRRLGETRERLLATALERVELGVGLTGADGRLVYANPGLAALADREREAVAGARPLDLLQPASAETASAIRGALAGGRGWSGDVPMATEGQPLILSCRMAPVRADGEAITHHIWIARDVSDERALEEQLATADKLATLGTLAAAVAHEINNPLSFITLHLEHLAEGLEEPEDREILSEILDGAERVRRTVRQLLDFARDPDGSDLEGSEADVQADVGRALDTAARLVEHELKHVATLEAFSGARHQARMPPEHLVQVLVNLLLNGSHAVAGRGQGWVGLSSRDEEGFVVIEVADDGPGVPEELRETVFEPLFTTKRGAMGTGLGLSHCRRLLSAAGATIEVGESVRGGARFTVRVPAGELARDASGTVSRNAVASWIAEREVAEPVGRVLIIDDEVPVARAMRRALRRHEVTLAHSVADALECLEGRTFDLILCDLMMPEATGADLYRALDARGDGSHRRLAIMTGGAFSGRERAFLESFDGPVIDKPVRVEALRERVATRLAAAGPDALAS